MIFDAIVLAGGRSSRLGGVPKALLDLGGESLAGLALDAALDARQRVVVGDSAALAAVLGDRMVLFAREHPPFAGPAAGVAAGLDALGARDAAPGSAPAGFVLVLACDMPRVASAVTPLLAAAREAAGAEDAAAEGESAAAEDAAVLSATRAPSTPAPADAFVARSPDGRLQPLAALYCAGAISRAVERHRAAGDLENLSIRALFSGLRTVPVDVPEGATDDIDTVEDAVRSGIRLP
ncbi:hypothetical protein B7R54_14075 [Subtercola boreus]|uniref:MobA-like NTP transferase domain-containing protein n=1 Tax=Subtercola boreus TaxID=120213 RepID=A0A3E0VKN0_9MICO|nr:NTP transferase domain-containing protein [Subtercola boreus]RFA10209.1 hypothetical protein B7R54_14075 [Subtercola boreus]TQL52619.1 molybdopterin-guanine dinucleotide biosynthesis protein A [Subtercola boreus]